MGPSGDSRLELDELGTPVDADGPVLDVLGGPTSSLDRLADRLSGSRRGRALLRHRSALATALVLLVALGTALVGSRPAPPDPVVHARVTALAMTGEDPEGGPPSGDPLVAVYRVQAADPGTHVALVGVLGPGVRASAPLGAAPGGQSVAVIPDCTDPAVLDPPSAAYRLELVRTDPDGGTVSGTVAAPAGAVDWGSAVRRACWRIAAARSLVPVSVSATASAGGRLVVLDVVLSNRTGRDVSVGAVDIADVATIAGADQAVVRDGGTSALRVRLPVTACPVGGTSARASGAGPEAPTSLPWVVGPADGTPVSVVPVPLSVDETRAVAHALRAACGAGPHVSVRVAGAGPAPVDAVVRDPSGTSLRVDLVVSTDADQLVLGQDPSGLTADARVAFARTSVLPRGGRAAARLTWDVTCAQPAAPPVLPVVAVSTGRSYRGGLVLDGPLLARAYSRACGLATDALVRAGWSLVAQARR